MESTEAPGSEYTGLTQREAEDRLREHGFNELEADQPPSTCEIAIGVLKEPMFLLLAVCSSLYFILGEYGEAAMLSSFVVFIVFISVLQERRTERALQSLRSLSPAVAAVRRDGAWRSLEARCVVPGDLVELREGDMVPADLVLLRVGGLQVDESLLTGESAPALKVPAPGAASAALQAAGTGALWTCFSGTQVVSGRAAGIVRATGEWTQIGAIGRSLRVLGEERSPLQREVRGLVVRMAAVGAVACLVVFVAYGLTQHDWLRATLSGLSLAMGLLPEEFPVVLSVFVTIGALRMSWRHVLVRRNNAVEALSSCTVVCTDKTGTLTTSGMAVDTLVSATGESFQLFGAPEHLSAQKSIVPERFHEIVEVALMAGSHPCDPMEAALRELIARGMVDTTHERRQGDGWALRREVPFCRATRCASSLWQSGATQCVEAAWKGAPEALLPLCTDLSPAVSEQLSLLMTSLTQRGLRVFAVARASLPPGSALPERLDEVSRSFAGLVAFRNPLRPSAAGTISTLQRAGVRVVMITGDASATALHIAEEAGIAGSGRMSLVTGEQLDRMDAEALREAVRTTPVFARVLPQQKLRIVQALKDNDEIVCMVGDGVNDAPALKSAHIGVAMGRRGTQVAREAAAMVLLDDELSTLAEAVRMGRRIRDNLIKTMAYIIAVHVPLCGMVVLPVLFHWPTIFYPAHIVWMELIIDPTCSVVLEAEPEEDDVMERPPVPVSSRVVSLRSLLLSLAQGVGVTIGALWLYHVSVNHEHPHGHAHHHHHHEWHAMTHGQGTAMAFGMLTVSNIALVLTNRSWSQTCFAAMRRRNVPLLCMIAIVFPLMLFVLFFQPLQTVMHFDTIGFSTVPVFTVFGLLSVAWFEVYKFFNKFVLRRHLTAVPVVRPTSPHSSGLLSLTRLEEGLQKFP